MLTIIYFKEIKRVLYQVYKDSICIWKKIKSIKTIEIDKLEYDNGSSSINRRYMIYDLRFSILTCKIQLFKRLCSSEAHNQKL